MKKQYFCSNCNQYHPEKNNSHLANQHSSSYLRFYTYKYRFSDLISSHYEPPRPHPQNMTISNPNHSKTTKSITNKSYYE